LTITKATISKGAYDKLLRLAKEYAPRIVCGFLVGKKEKETVSVEEVCDLRTKSGFMIHFQPVFTEFRRVSTELEKQGRKIVGEFHTHPTGGPEPTKRDRTIMGRVKFGFWIIATENAVRAMEFEESEMWGTVNVKTVPIEVV